ncbi:MAG: transposase is116/is110/is902 family protein [Alphaproteobacteria bacterium]|nr:MAG: transposase family protein [Caulobacteraceae bacterium]TPW07406.1 MAG: transposase is116/is110/is902 family protein [Alphaproteobacteria bacterium]
MFAGLDVSQETTAICAVDKDGVRVFEAETPMRPTAIGLALRPYRRLLSKVGHETGDSASWLHKALTKRKYPMVILDTRRTRAALAAQRNKTDRNDARDIALLLSRGLEAGVYVKGDEAGRTYRPREGGAAHERFSAGLSAPLSKRAVGASSDGSQRRTLNLRCSRLGGIKTLQVQLDVEIPAMHYTAFGIALVGAVLFQKIKHEPLHF